MSTPIRKLVQKLGARSAAVTGKQIILVSKSGEQKVAPDGVFSFPSGETFTVKGGRIVARATDGKPEGWRRGPVMDSDWWESWHENDQGGNWLEASWDESDDGGGGGWSWDEWDEAYSGERHGIEKLLDRKVPDAASILERVSRDFAGFVKSRPPILERLKKG